MWRRRELCLFLFLIPALGAQDGARGGVFGVARRAEVLLAAGDRPGLVALLRAERPYAHRLFIRAERAWARDPSPAQGRAWRLLGEALAVALGTGFYRGRAEAWLARGAAGAAKLREAWAGRPPPGDRVTAALVAVELAREGLARVPPEPPPEGLRTRLRLLREKGCPDGALDGLLVLARWAFLRGHYGAARRTLAAARALDRKVGGGRAFALAMRRGELALKEEAFAEAAAAFAAALAAARTEGERVRARAARAQAWAYLYELDKAGREAAAVAAALRRLPRREQPLLLFQLAEVAARQGRLSLALDRNRLARESLAHGGGNGRYRRLLDRQRAYLLSLAGRFQAAVRILRQGLEGARAAGDTLEQLHHLRALAELAYRRGRDGEALEWGLELLNVAREGGWQREEWLALRFLGMVHLRWGLAEEAALYLREGLARAEAAGSRRWEREMLRQLLYAVERLGRSEEGARYEKRLRRLLEEREGKGSLQDAADRLVLARLARERGDEVAARRDLAAARAVLAAVPPGAVDPLLRWLKGAAALEQAEQAGTAAEAEAALVEAEASAEDLGDPVLRAAVLFRRGRLFLQAGELEAAREVLEEALAAGQGVLAHTGHLPLRAAYLDETRAALERLAQVTVALARERSDPGPAGRLLELAEALRDRRFRVQAGAAAEERALQALSARLLDLLARWEAPGDLAPTARRALYADLAALRERYYRLVNRAWVEQGGGKTATRLDVGALRTRLGEALLVEYLCGPERAFALALDRRRGLRVFRLPAESRSLTGRVEFLDTFLQRLRPGHEAVLGKVAYGLFRDLLGPIAAAGWLRPGRPLVIVPDTALERLPFHALLTSPLRRDEDFRRLPYLILRHPIRYLTAAADLLRPPPKVGPASFFGVAPAAAALPGVAAEVASLARLFPPGRAWVLAGARASKETVLAHPALRRARILHFATHGRASPLSWLYSGLLLGTRRPDGDPVLHGVEIRRLRLAPALVVLSACATGREVSARGSTGVGWGRVFLHAGAAAVLVTPWPVEDRVAPAFMRRFYEELLRGRPADRALAAAVRHLLTAEPAWANPRYWAPFVLVGEAVAFSP